MHRLRSKSEVRQQRGRSPDRSIHAIEDVRARAPQRACESPNLNQLRQFPDGLKVKVSTGDQPYVPVTDSIAAIWKGHFCEVHGIHASNDGQAMIAARALNVPTRCELWDRARLVTVLDRHSA